jgi:hypothetical protein
MSIDGVSGTSYASYHSTQSTYEQLEENGVKFQMSVDNQYTEDSEQDTENEQIASGDDVTTS